MFQERNVLIWIGCLSGLTGIHCFTVRSVHTKRHSDSFIKGSFSRAKWHELLKLLGISEGVLNSSQALSAICFSSMFSHTEKEVMSKDDNRGQKPTRHAEFKRSQPHVSGGRS